MSNQTTTSKQPVENRHKAIRGLIKINNFIAWVLIITIIGSPIGMLMLMQGHMLLAILEIEHNTRTAVAQQY